jgi:hypothetical protein
MRLCGAHPGFRLFGGDEAGAAFGTLPYTLDLAAIMDRARPAADNRQRWLEWVVPRRLGTTPIPLVPLIPIAHRMLVRQIVTLRHDGLTQQTLQRVATNVAEGCGVVGHPWTIQQ